MRGKSLPLAGRHLHGDRGVDRGPRLPRGPPGPARRADRHDGDRPAGGGGGLRQGRARPGLRLGEGPLQGGPRHQRPRLRAQPRPEGRGLADVDQDGPDRPRPDGGQPPARRGRVRRGGARPQRDPGGLPGPAPLDRPLPQRRLHGGDPQLVLRLERHPGGLHLRHRERLPERRRDALRPPAHGHRADLRRRPDVLEPGRGEARDRARPPGPGGGRDHPPHQLGGGRARRHRRARPRTASRR